MSSSYSGEQSTANICFFFKYETFQVSKHDLSEHLAFRIKICRIYEFVNCSVCVYKNIFYF